MFRGRYVKVRWIETRVKGKVCIQSDSDPLFQSRLVSARTRVSQRIHVFAQVYVSLNKRRLSLPNPPPLKNICLPGREGNDRVRRE